MEFLGGVLTGLVVAVMVQLVVGVYIQPAIQLREAIWAVEHSILQYANSYGQLTPEGRKVEAQSRFRDHAGALSSKSRALMCYRVWVPLKLLPKRANVIKASRKLICLAGLACDFSNDAGIQASDEENEIRELLGIKTGQEA